MVGVQHTLELLYFQFLDVENARDKGSNFLHGFVLVLENKGEQDTTFRRTDIVSSSTEFSQAIPHDP